MAGKWKSTKYIILHYSPYVIPTLSAQPSVKMKNSLDEVSPGFQMIFVHVDVCVLMEITEMKNMVLY